MIARIDPVESVAETGKVEGKVYRSPLIPAVETNALERPGGEPRPAAHARRPGRAGPLSERRDRAGASRGARPRRRTATGIDHIYPGERIWVADQWLYLVGILGPSVLAPEIESSVLVGFRAAERYLHFNGHPNTVYLRAQNSQVAGRAVGARRHRRPGSAQRSQRQPALRHAHRPRRRPEARFNGLFLGLGAVALLVGAVGVANIMVISVLERRSEIGLRRALGATRGQIRTQFLSEAILLALGGGAVGVAAGALATADLRLHQGLDDRHPHRSPGRAGSARRS